jgi:hypothetical protein
VVEHQRGYRAESAYPQRLRLLCPVCFWQRGLDGSPPAIAAVSRGGLVVPLCNEHIRVSEACGFQILHPRSEREMEGELLAAYAVDLLPAYAAPGEPPPAYGGPHP